MKRARVDQLVIAEEDRISKLPDEILVSILSLMTNGEEGDIEQVVRTSLLSRRWRFLWKSSLKSLTFTFKEDDHSCPDVPYVEFVNRGYRILPLCDTIDDFNLTFEFFTFNMTHESDHPLRNWIASALQKRVKRLTIKLEIGFSGRFTLDNKVIRNHNMGSLVSLCLDWVDVTGEFLEYLLTICGSLEHLSVSMSTTLVDFTVSGLGLKLKYLKISACWELKHLYIRHVNLVSFEYYDRSCSTVVIENTPHLVNGGNTAEYLPLLETLVLEFGLCKLERPTLRFPKLGNLVRLELLLRMQDPPDFRCPECSRLLASSPSLRELKLLFELLTDTETEDKVERLEHPHECLKVVEIVGFIGCKFDIGVALYLIENTLSLEKIVVDTSHPYRPSSDPQWRDEESETPEREGARARAQELLGTRLLHTSTKFVLK